MTAARAIGLAAVVLSAGLVPAGAAAQDAQVQGGIVVTWRGDPARCGPAGLCGVSGRLAYRPTFAEPEAGHPGVTDVVLDAVTGTVVRVLRREPGLEPSVCTDLATFDLVGVRAGRRERLRLMSSELLPIAGRCAGPLDREVEAALPAAAIDPRNPGVLDFQGAKAFSAGPFTGEVTSDLTVRTGAPDVARAASARPRPRFATYNLAYRVERSSGALALDFRGAADPSCRLVDACGVAGTATHSLDLAGASVGIVVSRRLRRGERAGDLRAALRGGDVRFAGGADLEERTGRTTAEVVRPGGATCHDTVTGPSMLLVMRGSGRRMRASIPTAGSSMDPARTHCPGPWHDGVALATGSVPAHRLASRTLRLTLTARGRAAGPAYTGAARGELVLELRRTGTRRR